MTKKRILIFSHALELGGAERSLIGLLEAFDKEKYDIDLFLMRHEGELLQYIPSSVNLLPLKTSYTVLARPMIDTLKEGHLLLTTCRLRAKYAAKKFNKKNNLAKSEVALEYSHKYIKKWMPKVNASVEYDLAISFLTPHYFVAEKVKAKKRIAWIHTDYSKININVESELAMWDAYDYIASISDSVTKSFLSKFPSLEKKIIVIENILPENIIREQMMQPSDAESDMNEGDTRILSIGRFCHAKNFDTIPEILRTIRFEGVDAHWYLIGFGPDEGLIRKKIKEADMDAYMHVLGKKENPYPYIKQCDVYIQPSRYEGRCVTVKEAQMLQKPVIITRYATSGSQLNEGVDGIIVDMETSQCAKDIVKTIRNEELMNMLQENCKECDYSNRQEVEKLYSIIG